MTTTPEPKDSKPMKTTAHRIRIAHWTRSGFKRSRRSSNRRPQRGGEDASRLRRCNRRGDQVKYKEGEATELSRQDGPINC